METEKNCGLDKAESGAQKAHLPDAPAGPEHVEEKAPPLSTGDYIVMFILFNLPVINLILALVWGFGSGVNPNRKNFSRAWLVIMLIAFITAILMGLAAGMMARNLIPVLQEFFEGLHG